ncbi:hypothetical protein DAA51_16335 [Bradyrhizobium sp. WBAH10]|nr:hypothetical protein [Bradyrhizobium sp. WBAH33]NRB86151.1 hypothetical protein [Bradyrhizobium sp. WBAH10]QCJ82549.1 hypothetical protein DAA53_16460 [Bradyrhizobium sp. WBAH23]QCJ89915.1 hypothetical protein DAA57_16525 [Bradyrhizobium yuanmingense]QCK04666.1 hypothetical protein DAB18_16450 [Bradyrhizobium sp. WBAH41]
MTGTTEAGGCTVAGAFASVGGEDGAAAGSSAARDTATVKPATIATLRTNHPVARMTSSLRS